MKREQNMRKGGLRASLVFGLAGVAVLAMGSAAWAAVQINAVNDSASVNAGKSVTIDVLANDSATNGTIDPSTLQITIAPTLGTASVSGGAIVYTGGPLGGSDSLTYQVCVNKKNGLPAGVCGGAVVAISVAGPATPPTTTPVTDPPKGCTGYGCGDGGNYGGGDQGSQGANTGSTGASSGSPLPFTGADSAPLAALGVASIGGGLLMLRSSRTRRKAR
jgi:hypothetical protein